MERIGPGAMRRFIMMVLAIMSSAQSVLAHPMERIDYWQKNYTELSVNDPRAAHAHTIFTKILQVAGRRPGVVPRLFITKEEPLGVSLPIAIPDGGIILSKRVLDLCYRDPVRGADRLAFVLAHEIAHLLKDDFWHMKFFQALEASRTKTVQSTPELEEIRRLARATDQVFAKELQADEYGIVYASMAGFNTAAIVTEDGSVNFFADWIRALEPQPRSGNPTGHPGPTQRAEVVKARLRQILDTVEVFHVGLRFYQTGQYSRAVLAFQNFLQFFPSREVYHNLAASHHQLALQYYGQWKKDDVALPFRLSLAIDPATRASQLPFGGTDRQNKTPAELCAEHLAKAIEHYQTAISLDPTYALSYNNLGCALLIKGEVFKAIGVFQDALQLAPQAPDTLNNLGVAFQYAENSHKALEYLRQAQTLSPTHDAAVFNLGKLAYEAGHIAEAQRYWGSYLQLATSRPWIEAIQQKFQGTIPSDPWPASPQSSTEHLNRVRIGSFETDLPEGLGAPRQIRLSLEQEPFTIALYPGGIMTLSQDREILLLEALTHYRGTSVQGIAVGSSVSALLTRYGRPGKILHTTRGESWVYTSPGIAFQVHQGQVVSWLLF